MCDLFYDIILMGLDKIHPKKAVKLHCGDKAWVTPEISQSFCLGKHNRIQQNNNNLGKHNRIQQNNNNLGKHHRIQQNKVIH